MLVTFKTTSNVLLLVKKVNFYAWHGTCPNYNFSFGFTFNFMTFSRTESSWEPWWLFIPNVLKFRHTEIKQYALAVAHYLFNDKNVDFQYYILYGLVVNVFVWYLFTSLAANNQCWSFLACNKCLECLQ